MCFRTTLHGVITIKTLFDHVLANQPIVTENAGDLKPGLSPITEESLAPMAEVAYKCTVHNGKNYEVGESMIGIGDSGSSCNFCGTLAGMTNLRQVNVKVDGEFSSAKAFIAGDKLVEYKQLDGRTTVLHQEWFYLPSA